MTDLLQRPVIAPASMRRFAGSVITLAGAAMIIFSFVPWLRYAPRGFLDPVGRFTIDGWPSTLPDGLEIGAISPALWTVIAGGILVLCGLAIVDELGGLATTVLATLVAVAAFVAVSFFMSNPQAAFGLDGITPMPYVSAAVGLWVIFAASVFAAVGAISALMTAVGVRRAARAEL